MNKITLEKANISDLEIRSNVCNLHHDIAQYIAYVKNRSVKRSSRNNCLLKSDVVRISKLMPGQELTINDFDIEDLHYPGFIDKLAYNMDFVDFDIASNYYYNSLPDNYIKIKKDNYQKHINLSLLKQEEQIFNSLIYNDKDSNYENEFVRKSPVGILDCFRNYNVGIAVANIDFSKVRLFLFELLSNLEVNTWYSVKSLIEYLKLNHPYFLIPKHPKTATSSSYMQKDLSENRYVRFADIYAHKTYDLDTSYKDIFERVEGRYIERFLEYIPFLLGYTELAYKYKNLEDYEPSIGMLKAFRITPRFFNLRNKTIQEAKVIVQPNFEVSIESDIYPANIMYQLESLGQLVKRGVLSQIKLEKNKVIKKVAKELGFDPIEYLDSISSFPLPENIKIELKEWYIQADAFILYDNVALLETSFKFPNIEQFIEQNINKKFDIIYNPEGLINELERNQTIPIKTITHKNNQFSELSNEYKSIIAKVKTLKKKTSNNVEKLKMSRVNLIKLLFDNNQDFTLLSNRLLEKGCMINTSDAEKAIIIDQKNETILKEVLKDYKKKI